MKLIYFFLTLGFMSFNIYSVDECLKLSKKNCLKVNKCRWSKPNKSCISNYTASSTTNPTDLYSTKEGNSTIPLKECHTFTINEDCTKRTYCKWDVTSSKCILNPNSKKDKNTENSNPPPKVE